MRRQRASAWAMIAWVAAAGCAASANASHDDAGAVDLGVAFDAGSPAPTDAVVLPDIPLTAACPVVGADPRANHLRGDGVITLHGHDASWPYELDLYLPRGRVAGAPVLLAFPTHWPVDALTVVEGRFDDALGAAGLVWMPIYGGVLGFRGRMEAPGGGLALDLSGNLNGHSDTIEQADGRVGLCPAGDAPAPTLRSMRSVAPNGRVELLPSAPVGAGVDTVRLVADGVVVPADVAATDGVLVVTARAWLPPSADVSVDLGDLRDAMGRPFVLDGAVASLRTSAVVVDREFTDAPPAGAVAAERTYASTAGVLRTQPATRGPYYALVALGGLGAGETLVAQMRFDCGVDDFAVWVVGATGDHAAMPLDPDGGAAQALRASRASAGPAWLFVESRAERARPGWRGPVSDCTFALDRVGAE